MSHKHRAKARGPADTTPADDLMFINVVETISMADLAAAMGRIPPRFRECYKPECSKAAACIYVGCTPDHRFAIVDYPEFEDALFITALRIAFETNIEVPVCEDHLLPLQPITNESGDSQ